MDGDARGTTSDSTKGVDADGTNIRGLDERLEAIATETIVAVDGFSGRAEKIDCEAAFWVEVDGFGATALRRGPSTVDTKACEAGNSRVGADTPNGSPPSIGTEDGDMVADCEADPARLREAPIRAVNASPEDVETCAALKPGPVDVGGNASDGEAEDNTDAGNRVPAPANDINVFNTGAATWGTDVVGDVGRVA